MKRVCAVILLAASWAPAQHVSVGLKAGLPLTELLAASPGHQTATSRYTLGPVLEIGLPRRLAVEAGLLYKRVEYGILTPAGGVAGSAGAQRWELPLLLKYRFGERRVSPFAGAGVSLNWITGAETAGGGSAGLIELRHRGAEGFAGAAGLEAHLGRVRVAPEIRVTRWVDRNFGVRDAPLRSNLTQAELLVGFYFW